MKVTAIRSTIWAVFEKHQDKVVCLLCQATFKRSKYGTTSNLRRHIRANHKEYAKGLNLHLEGSLGEGSNRREFNRSNPPAINQLSILQSLNCSIEESPLMPFKEDVNESNLNDLLNEGNSDLTAIESLLYATSAPLSDLNFTTEEATPTTSETIKNIDEDLKEIEMENLRMELRKTIQELTISREERRNLKEELRTVHRLYLKKSIELDLTLEELDRLKVNRREINGE